MSVPSQRPAKIPELTGIRGIAASWVFSFHVWLVAGSPTLRLWSLDVTPFLGCGWAGVDLFFVLSGFVLTWPYVDEAARGRLKFGQFMRRRVLRVAPAYYAQFLLLLTLAAVGLIGELPSPANTAAHLLFLHNLNFAWSGSLDNAWWTLPIEWQFYLCFPLLLWGLTRVGIFGVMPILVAIVLVWRISAFGWIDAHHPAATVEYRVWLIEQLPGRIDQFFVGMASAMLTAAAWSRFSERDRQRLSAWLVITGAAAMVAMMYVIWARAQAFWQGHWLLHVWHLMAALPLAAMIAGAALHGRTARAVLGNRPMLWLGEISYSIYLWNYVVLLALVGLGAFAGLAPEYRVLWVAVYSIVPVVLVSALSWWLTERPFLHYRDPRPDDTIGRHLAAFIASPWRGLTLAVALMVAATAAAQWYWRPDAGDRVQCAERSALDSPGQISGPGIAHIAGWVHDWDPTDRVVRVVAVQDGRVLAETKPDIERPDVASAFPRCRVARPGFDMAIAVADLPAKSDILAIEAERTSGKRFHVGDIDWRFGPPRAVLDGTDLAANGSVSRLSGWAWHPAGPVQVRWRLGEKILATASAELQREDVAKTFPNWSGAEKSGYSVKVRIEELPWAKGETTLEFLAPTGERTELPGPRLENDHPIGIVAIAAAARYLEPAHVPLSVWAYGEKGIVAAAVVTELGTPLGALHLQRQDVPLPGLSTDPRGIPAGPFSASALRHGSLFAGDLPGSGLPVGVQRLLVRIRDGQGGESDLPGPLVATGLPPLPVTCAAEKFTVYLWATTKMLRSGLPELAELRRLSEGGCAAFGIHVRVEYLRTTKGSKGDFAFDPNFPEPLRFPRGKEMTTTSLAEALAMADRYAVPMRILLDGGVWADSRFSIPEYDITDWLETDDRNVQWNQFNRAEADDALKGMPGGHDNPELGRVMTLNIYNQAYRKYKKRNLQAAVRLIVEYNRKHADRPVSITLDPDTYISPWWFSRNQWYDYNPDTLRQFRDWLGHTGPYGEGGELSGKGHRQRLDLPAINRMAKADWLSVEDIDPPRGAPHYADPWHQIWAAFKHHLVGRHYADLAQWAAEVGLEQRLIFSAQTFIQSDVAVREGDPATGWIDQAGVSIAGAKPPTGHLGAILYGPASRNLGRPRSGSSLLANVRAADPLWQVAEMNPADIDQPQKIPSHLESYQTLTAIFNHGGGGISPMWTGTAGDLSVRPGQFKSYETFTQSPFETQLVLFLREAASLPVGSQLWTFGNAYVASDDGFAAPPGSRLKALPGGIELAAATAPAGGAAPCGITRDLEDWTAPVRARLRIEGPHLSAGRAVFRTADGRDLAFHWSVPAAGQAVDLDLAPLDGRSLRSADLQFDGCPVRIDRLTVSSTAGRR